jgi:broad specificity polyphosphatase/5'/3'-nucleotidase SurE
VVQSQGLPMIQKILITNDDGLGAIGLHMLASVLGSK